MTTSLDTQKAPVTRPAPVWKHMASGRVVDLVNLTADDIHWPDIVAALSRLARFDGATGNCFYVVAQHCCIAHDHAGDDPTARLLALLHDAHEGLIGDITTPTVALLQRLDGAVGDDAKGLVDFAKRRIDAAIFAAAGINATHADTYRRLIHALDARVMATEIRDVLTPSHRPETWGQLAAPLTTRIKPWGADKAAEEFAARLGLYGIDGRGL